MKKKLLALFLSLGMALSVAQPVTAHAEITTAEDDVTQSIATAEEKNFDTDYTTVWSEESSECWSKLTLDQQGILKMTSTIPKYKYGRQDIRFYVYDAKKNILFNYKTLEYDDSTVETKAYVGLKSGNYYIRIAPESLNDIKGVSSTYRFSFEPMQYCEIEENNSKDTAQQIKINKEYIGYTGSGELVADEPNDKEDVFAVRLKKGHFYKYVVQDYSKKNNYLSRMYGRYTDFEDFITNEIDADKFLVYDNDVFKAPYTGNYYIRFFNNSGKQSKYGVKVVDVTPNKTTIKSVKAGKEKATVKWTKVKGTNYQIQFSLDKNFKNAHTIDVKSIDTTSTVIKDLDSHKKYYVRVRAYTQYYANTRNNYKYSAWSNVKTVKTK